MSRICKGLAVALLGLACFVPAAHAAFSFEVSASINGQLSRQAGDHPDLLTHIGFPGPPGAFGISDPGRSA